MKHAKRSGWRPFWAALCAALLVLLPLVGGTVLQPRPAAQQSAAGRKKPERGAHPSAQSHRPVHRAAVRGRRDSGLCAGLPERRAELHPSAGGARRAGSALWGQKRPPADCYTAAGPARCREALGEVFALPEDTDYLAIAPAVLTKLAARYGAVRVGFTGALTPEQLARYGKGTGVQGISAADAHSFLAALDADTSLSPRRSAAARAAVWDAFFRQALELLPTTLPQGLREVSSSLLTSLTAVDLATLERTLEFSH